MTAIHKSRTAIFSVAGALTMMAHHVGAKSIRDSLFLASFEVAQLPMMVIVAALFSLGFVVPVAWATRRFSPGRLVPWMFFASAALYATLWTARALHPKLVAVAVFLAVVGFGGLLTSGLWALINECLDPYSLKKTVGHIGAGGSLGIAAGGLLAERVGATSDATTMLLVLAALHLICGLCAMLLRRAALSPPMEPESPSSRLSVSRWVLKLAREAPHFRILAALVLLVTVGAGMIDYVFKAESAARIGDKESLLRFFALFYGATGAVTFILQALVSRVALERFGLARAVGTMPLSLVAGSLGALAFPGLASAALARGSESIFRGSLFRSGYELFYGPVPEQEKRAAKPILDVGIDRLGDAVAGSTLNLILIVAPAMATTVVLTAATFIGLGGFWFALRLQNAYRDVLGKNLVTRRESLQRKDNPYHSGFSSAIDTRFQEPMSKAVPSENQNSNSPADSIADLSSGETERALKVLRGWNETPLNMVEHVIPLLGSTPCYAEALRVLRPVVGRCADRLMEALLSDETPESVRRRLPRVLTDCPTQSCLDGLMLGLKDQSFDVRYACGRALAALHRAEPKLSADRERLLSAVKREAALGRSVWEAFEGSSEQQLTRSGKLAHTLLENAGGRILEHIFTILTLLIPWEPLRLAYYALRMKDVRVRGTALEYLASVLPPDVREELWPYLEDARVKDRPRMSSEVAFQELLQTRPHEGEEFDKVTQILSGEDVDQDARGEVPSGALLALGGDGGSS